jgi:4'-phosphopantetheinyl transferase EntD
MRWAICSLDEVPSDDAWLGRREREVLATLDGERRRAEWRLGRWTAKRLLGEDEEILVAEDGAPAARLPLSIAHRRGRAMAVLGDEGEAIGCDLEPRRPSRDVTPFVAWEAAAKARRRGLLSSDPPMVTLGARTFRVEWPDGDHVSGVWRADARWVLAIALACEGTVPQQC